MVNRHGLLVNVRPDLVADAIKQGARLATLDDLDAAGRECSEFAMRFVRGFEYQAIDLPIVVRGAGPSACAPMGVKHLGLWVNPRADQFGGGYALALDNAYWKGVDWQIVRHAADGCFAPEYGCASAPPDAMQFGLPVVADSKATTRLEMRTNTAIMNCHISAVAALLVARFITSGPVILTGCDLSGTDGNRGYAERQLPIFERALPLIENVFAHPQMGGPLRNLLPEWGEE